MDHLFDYCRNMVLDNTSVRDTEVVNILSYAILSIFLYKGNEVLALMPHYLRTLNIYSDNRDVSEVLYDLGKSKDKNYGKHMISCLNREYHFKKDQSQEVRTMIIPRNNKNENILHTIEKTAHELVHVLRLGSITKEGNSVILREGIETKTIDAKTKKLQAINSSLEEAFVQDVAKNSVGMLVNYIDQFENTPMLSKIKRDKSSYKSVIYEAHVILLDFFKKDPIFKKLLDEHFLKLDYHKLENYYNSIMNYPNAFQVLSYYFDQLNYCIDTNNVEKAVSYVNLIHGEIARYHSQNAYQKNRR